MTLTQVKTFQPGEVRTAQITVLNTGNQTAVYALEITAGETGIFGFASQRSPVLVLTPPVSPGQQRQIPVPVQLPDAPGPKAFRIRIGEAGPTGQIIQEFDEELFTGFAQVALATMIPLPTEPPALPAAPTSQELALQFRDALGTPSITVSPTQVDQGETVSGTLSIPSAAAIPFTPRLTVTLIQFTSAGAFEVRTIVQPRSVSLGPGDDITQGFSIDTAALAESVYGLRVVLIDPTTGIVLIDETFNNLFTVSLPALPAPPAIPAPPVRAKLQPGDLSVGPVVNPKTAVPGDSVVVTVGVINPTQITQLVVLDARLVPPTGQPIDLSRQVTVVPGTQTFTAPTWVVPTTAPSGDYRVRIIVIDPATLTVLEDFDFGTLFAVEAAPTPVDEFLEEEFAPPAPVPTPSGSDIAVSINYSPTTIRFLGEETTLTVNVTNVFGDFNFGVEVSAVLTLPANGFQDIGPLGQQIIPPTFGLLVIDQRRTFTGVLRTVALPNGSYGAQVTVRSFESKQIIKVVSRPAILAIIR